MNAIIIDCTDITPEVAEANVAEYARRVASLPALAAAVAALAITPEAAALPTIRAAAPSSPLGYGTRGEWSLKGHKVVLEDAPLMLRRSLAATAVGMGRYKLLETSRWTIDGVPSGTDDVLRLLAE